MQNQKETKSQSNLIKDYLEAGNKLTPIDVLNKFGCFRLGARIFDLKKQGLNIKTSLINVNNKTFAEYSI